MNNNNNISFDCECLSSLGNGYTELVRRMHLLGEAIGFGIIRVDMVSLSWEGGPRDALWPNDTSGRHVATRTIPLTSESTPITFYH